VRWLVGWLVVWLVSFNDWNKWYFVLLKDDPLDDFYQSPVIHTPYGYILSLHHLR
jgi:hypothetical protein